MLGPFSLDLQLFAPSKTLSQMPPPLPAEALLVMFVESADTQQACTFMGLCSGSLAAALKPGPLPVPLLRAMTASRLSLEKAAGLPPLSGPAGAGAGGRPLLGPGGLPPRHLAHPLLGAGPGPANGNGCDMCKVR